MGTDLGHRRRRRHRRVRDLPCAGPTYDRHVGQRREARAAREWGADVTVNHHDGDVVAAVKEATGKGVTSSSRPSATPPGRARWPPSPGRPGRRLRRDERPEPARAAPPVLVEAADVLGSTMGTRDDFLGAYELVRSGRARVHVDRVFPLAEIAAAHERLEAGEQLGKIVLVMPRSGS